MLVYFCKVAFSLVIVLLVVCKVVLSLVVTLMEIFKGVLPLVRVLMECGYVLLYLWGAKQMLAFLRKMCES